MTITTAEALERIETEEFSTRVILEYNSIEPKVKLTTTVILANGDESEPKSKQVTDLAALVLVDTLTQVSIVALDIDPVTGEVVLPQEEV